MLKADRFALQQAGADGSPIKDPERPPDDRNCRNVEDDAMHADDTEKVFVDEDQEKGMRR